MNGLVTLISLLGGIYVFGLSRTSAGILFAAVTEELLISYRAALQAEGSPAGAGVVLRGARRALDET